MIGKTVKYKEGADEKEYIIVDFSEKTEMFDPEICILVDFPYYPNRIKQLKIWQPLYRFYILD